MSLFRRFAIDESGTGAVEYGLLACMIACFVISAVQKIGVNLSGKLKVILERAVLGRRFRPILLREAWEDPHARGLQRDERRATS